MDVLYIGLKSQPLFRFGVSPNKLIDYLMAGKPILYAIDSGNTPVADARCGISIAPENPNALAQAVRRLLTSSPSQLEEMGERGRSFCLQHHDYRTLALRFLKIAEASSLVPGTVRQATSEAVMFDEVPGD
jgi:glycosyltransferase involved in cell wall biosynthesis